MYLTREQQTIIGRAIIAAGMTLDKLDREGFGSKASLNFQLTYRNKTSYRFNATTSSSEFFEYVYCYSPYETPSNNGGDVLLSAADFQTLVDAIAHWIRLIVEEEDPVDPWLALLTPEQVITTSDNTPFDKTEFAVVIAWLQDAKKELLEKAQSNHDEVIERIATLEEGAKHFGRKDFVSMVLGTIFSFVLSNMIPPDTAKTAIDSFLNLTTDSLKYLRG